MSGEQKGNNMIESSCRCCGNKNLKSVIDLGKSPLANNLLNDNQETAELYPLEVLYCNNCHYCQLSYSVPSNKLFDTYLYTSSTTKSFQNHFREAAQKYAERFKLTSDSCVLDIGCNDGIALIPFKEMGIKVFGVDPASNIIPIVESKGIDVMQAYFNEDVAEKILQKLGKVDLVTASNVFAHSPDIDNIVKGVFKLLKEDGTFVVEVQYVYDTVKDLTFDNIYHEHVSYWSVSSLSYFFNKHGYTVVDVEHIPTHGGSIRVYVQNKPKYISSSVSNFIQKEINEGFTSFDAYRSFGERIKRVKHNISQNIVTLKKEGYKLVGYGAPAKATTALNFYQIDNKIIDYVVEDNKLKHNKIIPGINIPIYSKDIISINKPDIIIVLAWNFFLEIEKNNPQFKELNIKLKNIKELEQPPENFNMYLL